ncbi:13753_t:CDS:2 [Ambispora leptoticha]|uniref:13753_t:CDS:1 n=1 Tax=Ambispora leptoticha TaxID=144679 RepID=A0A9N9AN64_9GLOM|nr:13753_t:CDS:2 [Ambispora leptoticha]
MEKDDPSEFLDNATRKVPLSLSHPEISTTFQLIHVINELSHILYNMLKSGEAQEKTAQELRMRIDGHGCDAQLISILHHQDKKLSKIGNPK